MKKNVFSFVFLAVMMMFAGLASAQKPCDTIFNLPWWEDFQAYPHNTTPPTVPSCWHFQGSNEPSVGQYNVHGGYMTCILDLYSSGTTWAVLQNPFSETYDINSLQVTFSAGKSSSSPSHNSDLIIGITSNPTNPSDANFTPLDTVLQIPYNSGDTMPRFTVDFVNYHDSGRYFCFKTQPIMSSGTNFLAIDSLVFDFNDHCMTPTHLEVSNVSDMSAAISSNNVHSNTFQLAYKEVGDTGWTYTTYATRWHVIQGLTPETRYMARLRQDCNASYSGYSDWSDTVYFTTDSIHCRRPSGLIATNVANTSIDFAWTPEGYADNWELHVFNSTYNRSFNANTPNFTVTGLSHGTNYRVSARSLCDASNMSDWGDTIMVATSSCFAVNNVNAFPGVHDAVINWLDNTNTNPEWEVSYGLPGFVEGSELGIEHVSGTPQVTIAGLDSATNYVAKVRALCDDGHYSEYTSVAFQTLEGTHNQGIDGVEGMAVAIYPNPATTATTISVKGAEGRLNVTVVDMDGRVVRTFVKDCPSDCEMVMDVEGLAKGSYVVRLHNDKVNETRIVNVQ